MKFILGLLFLVAGLAQAQTWPGKPVRVIVNVAAGGVADVTMRVLGARMQETLGQPFVVENRAGGDGYIGFDAVARADADGSTLLYSPGSSMMIAPHIAVEVFNREAKVKTNHVPYKGAGPALKDLLGGQIDFAFDPGVGLAPAKAGKLRMIAIAGPARHPDFPDVPTLEENGIKGVDGGPHFGLYAPSATPKETILKINAEMLKAMQDPTVRDRFKALAVDVAEPMTPEQFAAYVRGEHARYAKLIPELGIKGQ